MKLLDWTLAIALVFALFFIWGVVEDRIVFKIADSVCADKGNLVVPLKRLPNNAIR